MASSLSGKTAIITGAGSGINLAFARLLLAKHCNVLFADLALRPEAQELVNAYSPPPTRERRGRAVFQKTDVRDWKQLERMFDVACQEFGAGESGGVDIVCPGAGVYEPPFSSFWHPPGSLPSRDDPTSSHYALLDINLTHPIRTTQLAISRFLSRRRRPHPRPHPHPDPRPNAASEQASSSKPTLQIIHISSIAAQITPLLAPLYNASKHALSGFVRTLAPLDQRLGIRVTAVAPGVIDTPLWRDNPEKLRLVGEGHEWISAEDVAGVMEALVMEEEVEVLDFEVGGRAIGKETTGVGAGQGGKDARDEKMEKKKMVKVEGGLILEIAAKGRVRKVEQFGDPGPGGEANTAGHIQVADEEIFERLRNGDWGC